MRDQNDNFENIERMLARFQPAGPGAGLRARVLASARPMPVERTWPLWIYRTALAAMLLLAFGLHRAALQINQTTASQIGIGPARWTDDAEYAANLIGGETGRQYVAWYLTAGATRDLQLQLDSYPKGAFQ